MLGCLKNNGWQVGNSPGRDVSCGLSLRGYVRARGEPGQTGADGVTGSCFIAGAGEKDGEKGVDRTGREGG